MSSAPPNVQLSAIDEERFGITIARASDVTLEAIPAIIDFCNTNGVRMLIARCLTSQLEAAQGMERQGFALMDTLVYYRRDIQSSPIPENRGNIIVREFSPGDEDDVSDLAARAFQKFAGHYHADKRLDRTQCKEVYASWAYRSCMSQDVADNVLLAKMSGSIAGLLTLRINHPDEGEGPLLAVDTDVRGKGVAQALMIRGIEWCASKSAKHMTMSTQVTNLPARKVYVRLGFEPAQSYYTFHKWFDNE